VTGTGPAKPDSFLGYTYTSSTITAGMGEFISERGSKRYFRHLHVTTPLKGHHHLNRCQAMVSVLF
jgi:hypothetical protein